MIARYGCVGCARASGSVACAGAGRQGSPASADAPVFVAFREQRAGVAFLQHGEIQTKVFVVIVRSHVEPLRAQTKIGRGEKPQILAARIPRRPDCVGETVGYLFGFAGLDIADEDGVIHRAQTAGIRDPFRVRTPDRIQRALRHHPRIAADNFRFAAGYIQDPDVQAGIAEKDLL